MTVVNPRDEILQLDGERKEKTEKLIELTKRLKDLNTNLTDPLVIDGFPRNDIDLYQVRAVRQEYRQTQNDLYALDKRIEKLMPLAFTTQTTPAEISPVQVISPTSGSRTVSFEQPSATPIKQVVLSVNAVDPDSPSFLDGLQRGDLIESFKGNSVIFQEGDFKIQSRNLTLESKQQVLEFFASTVKENIPLELKIKRRTDQVLVVITPRPWDGRGLLGCHLSVDIQ